MVTYCPLPPRVSTWIGTCVALGAADAPGAGEALVPPAGAWGAQPGASSSARVAASLAERIGAYYGKGERNDLETEREEQVERVDRAVEQQRDQRRRQPEAERPLERARAPGFAQHPAQDDRERCREGHDGDDTAIGCESYRKRVGIERD